MRLARGRARNKCGGFDKGKIVKNLMSISICLFCIFLFIFIVLCLFWCFRSNLEKYGRKEPEQVKKGQNWQKSIKQVDSR